MAARELPVETSTSIPEGLRDLKVFTRKGRNFGSEADGSVELGWMRGFQAGYEQAIADQRRGELKRDHALMPQRQKR